MDIQAQLQAFKAQFQEVAARDASFPPSKFVKKIDEIPSLEFSPSDPCWKALILSEKSLICKFTWLFPSHKAVEIWIVEQFNPIFQGWVSLFVAGRGYFVFSVFE